MAKRNYGKNNSQTLGILWLSIGLITIMLVAFFVPRKSVSVEETDTAVARAAEILSSKEKNHFKERYAERPHGYTSHNSQVASAKSFLDSNYQHRNQATITRKPLLVELNTADTLTLQLLHGIGPAYARRIVRYRDRLGGFTRIDQLLEVYGFSEEMLNHIAPHLTLDTSAISRIPINSVPLKQLIKHPYIEYYQARDIIYLRNKGNQFCTVGDLKAVPSMADSTLQKLLPYIDFSPVSQSADSAKKEQ